MKLYGTTTSPFVRRVAIVATELGEPIEWVDTATDQGQAALRERSPIRKVPAAIVDGRTLYDSKLIADWLITTRGYAAIAPPRDRWRDANLINAADAAIDSLVQLLYLRRDGVAVDGTPYAQRQLERVEAILTWLGAELDATRFGLPEISAICALDWMDFRAMYPTERATTLLPLRAALRDRPSLLATRPRS
jgi:glutathione S-transferase